MRDAARDALAGVCEGSSVLDIGCGSGPYRRYLPTGCRYIGADVAGPSDIRIEPGKAWPIESESVDVVLCTEVLEHVEDHDHVLGEIRRVLKTQGMVIVSVPFLYNEHGAPVDFRRYTAVGLVGALSGQYRVERVRRLGGIGTTLGILLLNWIDASLTLNKTLQYLKPVLFPAWLPICLVVNVFSVALDVLDRTGAFYISTMIVARKR